MDTRTKKPYWYFFVLPLLIIPFGATAQVFEQFADSVNRSSPQLPEFIRKSTQFYNYQIDAAETFMVATKREGKRSSVWQCANVAGKWQEPEEVVFGIEEPNISVVDLSADGQTMLLSIVKNGKSDIYMSRLEGQYWSVPNKLTEVSMRDFDEPTATMSYDERFLYLSSNRPGGFGGYDLYVSQRLDDGSWSQPANMGASINSSADENFPKIHSDGQSLFFSTNRTGGRGGYDVFYSVMKFDSTWTTPEPMQFDINTADDETAFSMSVIKKYFTWNRTSAQQNAIQCIEVFGVNTYTWQVVFTGQVALSREDESAGIVNITISDAESKEIIGEYHPNDYTGTYTYILSPERKYNVLLTAPGYIGYTHDFWVSEDSAYNIIRRPVLIEKIQFYNPPMKVRNGEKFVRVSDILFDLDGFHVPENDRNLNILCDYLKENPDCVLEIGGYADAIGNANYNQRLSRMRALDVAKYLVRHGVKSSSYLIRDYGQSKPIANIGVLEAQHFNRRVEFKVLKEGKIKLEIGKIEVPEKFKYHALPKEEN